MSTGFSTEELIYNYGWGINGFEINHEKAFSLAQNAANANDEVGYLALGFCYYEGWGVEKNYKTSLSWFEQTGEHEIANCNRGIIYYFGGFGVDIQLTKSVECFRNAASVGNAKAQELLADIYYTGEGAVFAQSFETARKLYKLAADQKNTEAQCKLETMRMLGLGGNDEEVA